MALRLHFLAIIALLLAACAPSSPTPTGSSGNQAGQSPSVPKSIVVAINEDPGTFWDGITGGGGGGGRQLGHLTNQYLVALRSDASPEPRLLAELPNFQNGLWTVAPDGRMQVTWKLRPNVVWHDGTALTADDIVFSWLVNRDPEVPNGNQAAVKLIDRAEARDATTVVTAWAEAYPYADRLEHRELIPLPRHLVQRHYQEAKDTLLLQPYFSSEYVGLGPYRVDRWERGSHLDLVAFDQYFLGRPKIERIRVQFIPDDNTGLANLKAGTLHTFLPTGGPTVEQIMLLKGEWDANKRGVIITESVRWTFAEAQKGRSAQPASLADARVRHALQHALDREELTRTILGDLGIVADSWVHPDFKLYSQVQPILTRYPYDPRRATAILTELGWQRGSDGVLERGTEKFNVSVRYREQDTREAAIMREQWKAIGVNANLEHMSDMVLRDRALRAQFTGFDTNSNPMGGLSAVRRFIAEAIPTPENRWTGTNRGGASNPTWDELGERLRVTLDESKQIEIERELVRIFTSELFGLPIYYEVQAIAVGGGLTGMHPVRGVAHTGHVMHTGNVHEWDVPARS